MKVTDVRINYPRKKFDDNGNVSKLRGYARILLDGTLAINSIRLIDTGEKRYLIFPERESNRKDEEGRVIMLSVVNPTQSELRVHVNDVVWEAYDNDPTNPFIADPE